jgi:hypothetical protein
MELSRHWIMQIVRYRLVGEKCETCGPIFPPRDICPGCGQMVKVRGLGPEPFNGEEFERRWKARSERIQKERELGVRPKLPGG